MTGCGCDSPRRDEEQNSGEFEELASMSLEQLTKMLCDVEGTSIPMRTRVLWQIKGMGGEGAVRGLAEGLKYDRSALMRHEIAYAMGQLRNPVAIPILVDLLEDRSEDCMVRHEAAEALGNIANPRCVEVLQKYLNDESREVRETCEIALHKIQWETANDNKDDETCDSKEFSSVDPAPAFVSIKDVKQLRAIFLDAKNKTLFERYKAMFALRNIGNSEAVEALCEGFKDESALFRHEVAFVLGQLQHPHSAEALKKVLDNTSEHAMVRHEAAEALGSISSTDAMELLKQYSTDSVPAVKESCEVALDIADYWNKFYSKYKASEDEEEEATSSACK